MAEKFRERLATRLEGILRDKAVKPEEEMSEKQKSIKHAIDTIIYMSGVNADISLIQQTVGSEKEVIEYIIDEHNQGSTAEELSYIFWLEYSQFGKNHLKI